MPIDIDDFIQLKKELLDEVRHANKEVLAGDSILFTDYMEDWFKGKSAVLADNTKDKYRALYDVHIKPTFEKLMLTEVTLSRLQDLINAKIPELASATIREIKSAILAQAFKKAQGMGLIKLNPVQFVETPKVKQNHSRPLTNDEITKLINVSKCHRLGITIPLLLLSGMRRSEMLGLTWDDIDFIKKEITINKGFVSTRSKGNILKETKTESSNRIVAIPTQLIDLLKSYRKNNPDRIYLIGQSKADKRVEPNNFSRLFRKWCKQAGIENISPHSLRHTFCTLCQENSIDTFTIMQQVGHTDSRMLERVYVHKRSNELQQRAADTLGEKLGGLLASA